jgi:5'-AMP-activated protein kinase regulatory gamma subunit
VQSYQKFLREHTIYDMMPLSGKVLVLDTRLDVRQAFQALSEQDMKSATLWDEEIADFVGVVTVTDFIDSACTSIFTVRA